jgi:hypothetical protein
LRALLLLLDSKHYDDFQKLVMQREEEKPDPDTPEMLVGRVAQLVQMGGARVLFRMSGTTSDRTREVVAKAYLQLAEMAPFRGFIVQQSGVPALTKIANKVLRCVPSDVSIAPPLAGPAAEPVAGLSAGPTAKSTAVSIHSRAFRVSSITGVAM